MKNIHILLLGVRVFFSLGKKGDITVEKKMLRKNALLNLITSITMNSYFLKHVYFSSVHKNTLGAIRSPLP